LDLIKELGKEQAAAQSIAQGHIAVNPWLHIISSICDIMALGDCLCVVSGQLPATGQVASQQGEYLA
jgi:NADH dehydrogenase FAD-containing subunit